MMSSLVGLAQSGGLDGALSPRASSTRRLHQAAPVPLRGRLLRVPRRGTAPARHPMGNDERDRQLPRPGLALALHLLVPDRAVQHSENADAQIFALMASQSRVHLHPFIPGLRTLPGSRGPPADLARPLPTNRRRPVAPDGNRRNFTAEEARRIGEEIGIDWDHGAFRRRAVPNGMDVELEHGLHDPPPTSPATTLVTGRIAFAHLTSSPTTTPASSGWRKRQAARRLAARSIGAIARPSRAIVSVPELRESELDSADLR